ncbi:MAG TPA: hemolysin family protein [Verrucomicrobiae bacterium]|nr:hemolysin family protein [Verrucomicrobiae bacterium]
MSAFWLIIAILAGILASALFSGVETGLISLNRLRLRHEVERKNRRAVILNTFVENSERLLGTTLIGNNLANVLMAVAASALATQRFGTSYAVGLAATFMASALLLIFGEIVPKTLFRHYPHRLCMTLADALEGAAWLFAPFVAVFGVLMRLIAGVGRSDQAPKSVFVTREELKYLAKEGEGAGALTAEEREMIHGVFDFRSKTVFEAMIPIARTVTVSPGTPVRELFDLTNRTGFARFPVREADRIVGIVNVYEILFETKNPDDMTAGQLMRKPQFIVSTERIDRALPALRASHQPVSVVVNPEAKHIGIISIEDIVEEIVGDVEG